MTLAVVAFPHLERVDREWIESLRAAHDPQANRIAAHFTLVFPVNASADDVGQEVAMVARSTTRIAFVARRTKMVGDGTRKHIFLVPDEGAAEITTLHNRLYSGVLKPHLRTDIPFTPHMTIGVAPDSTTALELANRIEVRGRVLRGAVRALELLDLSDARIQSVATHTLR